MPEARDTSKYIASYAPTDRAKCKMCKLPIAKGALRLSRDIFADWTGDQASTTIHYHRACGLKAVEAMKCTSPATVRTYAGKVPTLVQRGVPLLRSADALALRKAFDKAKAKFVKKCTDKQ